MGKALEGREGGELNARGGGSIEQNAWEKGGSESSGGVYKYSNLICLFT